MCKIKTCFFYMVFFLLLFTLLPNQVLRSEVYYDKFVVLTPLKGGTHLLTKVIGLIINKKAHHRGTRFNNAQEMFEMMQNIEQNNMFFDGHQVTPEILQMLDENEYKIISIMRDPRDQLLSILNWSLEGRWPEIPITSLSKEEQINEFITGDVFGFQAFEQSFEGSYKISLIDPLIPSRAYLAHFENLVGPDGGGTVQDQILEIINIAEHLGVPMDITYAGEIAAKAFGGTTTFRNGQIGEWKNHFTELNKIYYKMLYGEILIDWGYERDCDW